MQYGIYELLFRRPFKSSVQTLRKRKGIVLVQDDPAGPYFGDVAPLDGFSTETNGDALKQLQRYKNDIEHFFTRKSGDADWIAFADSLQLYPSVRFGLDTLYYDRIAKLKSRPLNKHFSNEALQALPVNYTLSGEGDGVLSEINLAVDRGFRHFKLKGGIDFERDKSLLSRIRERYPQISLRLDVNEAWDPDTAVSNLHELESVKLEYCEQPIPAGNTENLKALKSVTSIPIAADESVRSGDDARALIKNRSVDFLILKPALIGSYTKIAQIAREAEEHDIPVIFTSVLESGIGRLATAHLASWLGSPDHAHGLATGFLFENDILRDEAFVSGGYYRLPEAAGLGAKPDPELINVAMESL